jgi:hypothetical protein
VIANVDVPAVTALVRDRLGVPVQVDVRRRSVLVRELAVVTDVIVLPTLGDDIHVRGVTTRVLPAVPLGASLLVALAEGSPDGLSSLTSGARDSGHSDR